MDERVVLKTRARRNHRQKSHGIAQPNVMGIDRQEKSAERSYRTGLAWRSSNTLVIAGDLSKTFNASGPTRSAIPGIFL